MKFILLYVPGHFPRERQGRNRRRDSRRLRDEQADGLEQDRRCSRRCCRVEGTLFNILKIHIVFDMISSCLLFFVFCVVIQTYYKKKLPQPFLDVEFAGEYLRHKDVRPAAARIRAQRAVCNALCRLMMNVSLLKFLVHVV